MKNKLNVENMRDAFRIQTFKTLIRAVEIPGVGVPGVDSFGKFAGVIAGVASFSLELTP